MPTPAQTHATYTRDDELSATHTQLYEYSRTFAQSTIVRLLIASVRVFSVGTRPEDQ